MPARGFATEVLDDKLQAAALLGARGLAVPRTLAACVPTSDASETDAKLAGLRALAFARRHGGGYPEF